MTRRSYLDNMCKAKSQDGVKVTHYFAWSLLDNWECECNICCHAIIIAISIIISRSSRANSSLWAQAALK